MSSTATGQKTDSYPSPPYHVLAEVYDRLMADVDYEAWADFIDEIMLQHHAHPYELLELACGTGEVARYLNDLECYDITATDVSEAMIKKAKSKPLPRYSQLQFRQMDFLNINLQRKFDVVYSLFDSINYLHDEQDIVKLFTEVAAALKEDGQFIFDFTTPQNSEEAVKTLHNEESKRQDNLAYFRESYFDSESRIHTNIFTIKKWIAGRREPKTWKEVHQQKIFTLNEMLSIIEKSPLKVLAKYSGFELVEADEQSLRITMVLGNE